MKTPTIVALLTIISVLLTLPAQAQEKPDTSSGTSSPSTKSVEPPKSTLSPELALFTRTCASEGNIVKFTIAPGEGDTLKAREVRVQG